MDIDAEKLLYLIEARSPIYDYKNKEHATNMIIGNLWIEIATEMNCPVSECKKKWSNLRNAYTRHLREEKNKLTGSSAKPKKKWYLADAMSFVKDYINLHRGSLDSPDVDDSIDEISEVDYSATLNDESTQSHTSPARNSPVPTKRKRTLVTEMLAGPMMEFLQSRTREKRPENANALFFKCLLADYEKLSSRSQRSFRLHMLNKMNELQEEEEHDALKASTSLSAECLQHPEALQHAAAIRLKQETENESLEFI